VSQTKNRFYKTEPYRRILIFVIPVILLLIIVILSWVARGSQQISNLAQAFVHGHLYFLKPIGGVGQDPVLYHGRIYWSEGPLPAVLLMPFVGLFDLFHGFFFQSYLQGILLIGVIFLVFQLARRLAFSKEDSLTLMLGFVLGSVFIGVAAVSSSWFFAQIVTVFLLLWGLYEYFGRKRLLLLGIICGLVLLSRATAAPILLFFILELWFSKINRNLKWLNLAKLCLPVLAAVALVGLYNYLRFHSPFNGGYKYQLLASASAESRSLGVFSLIHIPTNIYYGVLGAPLEVFRSVTSWTLKFPYIQNNPYGMSIFITSPYLLYIFVNKWKSFNSQAKHLLVAILASCLIVFSYYGVGAVQFGYRYALDFLPEVFVLLMILYKQSHERLSRGMKTLLLGSGLVNFYLLMASAAVTSYLI